MTDIKKIDNELYMIMYVKPNNEALINLWDKIKSNKEILIEAIKLTKNKYNEDTLAGLTICDCMLVDYLNIDKEIYNELVNTIYSNQRIARIVLDGASNGGYSFLLMTLWNDNLKLTEEQKAFAVSEAMNKIGTTKYQKEQEEYSKELDKQGITNDMTTIIGYGKDANPIGAKAGCEYMNFIFCGMSDSQGHGTGAFDIRYQILRNTNWTIEEKRKLVNEFYCDDEMYDEFLDEWCWSIINHNLCRKESSFELDNWCLFEYTYNDILELSQSKEIADEVWEEINFCKMMYELRMPSWQKESTTFKKIRT